MKLPDDPNVRARLCVAGAVVLWLLVLPTLGRMAVADFSVPFMLAALVGVFATAGVVIVIGGLVLLGCWVAYGSFDPTPVREQLTAWWADWRRKVGAKKSDGSDSEPI